MLNIPIDKNLKITSDAHNYIICVKTVIESGKNKGDERWTPKMFYPTLETCLEGLLNHKLRTESCQSLSELVVCVKKLKWLLGGILELNPQKQGENNE